MSHMFIFRGIPAAGKSTLARSLSESDSSVRVVCRDDIRFERFGEYVLDLPGEEEVTRIEHKRIAEFLSGGLNVVVDSTNTHPKRVKELSALAESNGASFSEFVVTVDLDEALERNRNRLESGGRFVPEDVIRKMHKRLMQSVLEPMP